jgi:hypothetical protein
VLRLWLVYLRRSSEEFIVWIDFPAHLTYRIPVGIECEITLGPVLVRLNVEFVYLAIGVKQLQQP